MNVKVSHRDFPMLTDEIAGAELVDKRSGGGGGGSDCVPTVWSESLNCRSSIFHSLSEPSGLPVRRSTIDQLPSTFCTTV